MESPEVIQRRRDKILARSTQSESNDDVPEEGKYKIVKQIQSLERQEESILLIISVTFGFVAALLNVFMGVNQRYLLIWGTLYGIILMYYHNKRSVLEKKMHNDELRDSLSKLLPNNSQLVGSILRHGEKVLLYLKEFRNLIEGVIIFNVVFVITNLIIQN